MKVISRKEAIAAGLPRYFTGKPCLYGHLTERRVKVKRCIECLRLLRKEKRLKNVESIRLKARTYLKSYRERALIAIMAAHGISGCHFKIHPNMPIELKKHKCWGDLWLEHPNGGGHFEIVAAKTTSQGIIRQIATGRLNPKKYLVLCQLHQIWNNHNPNANRL